MWDQNSVFGQEVKKDENTVAADDLSPKHTQLGLLLVLVEGSLWSHVSKMTLSNAVWDWYKVGPIAVRNGVKQLL